MTGPALNSKVIDRALCFISRSKMAVCLCLRSQSRQGLICVSVGLINQMGCFNGMNLFCENVCFVTLTFIIFNNIAIQAYWFVCTCVCVPCFNKYHMD